MTGRRRAPGSFALLAGILLAGCGGEPGTPESQIIDLIAGAEAAVEERDAGALADLLSESYSDDRGQSKHEIMQRLRLYLFRHQSVHLYISIDSIEFPVPELAEVKLVAGMAGRGIPDGSDWRLEADVYEFDIRFELDDDEWKVISANWQRSGR